MNRTLLIFVFSLAFYAAGCVQITQIDPQNRLIGDVYSIDPQITWSAMEDGKSEIWTVDGVSLQAVRFVKGLEDGDTLFEPEHGQELPKFHKDMRETPGPAVCARSGSRYRGTSAPWARHSTLRLSGARCMGREGDFGCGACRRQPPWCTRTPLLPRRRDRIPYTSLTPRGQTE